MISELILAAHFLAAYASHPLVAHRMARLAASLPAMALAGLDFHQLDSIDWFHSLMFWFLQSQALLGAICFIFADRTREARVSSQKMRRNAQAKSPGFTLCFIRTNA
jgi:hypothetical protein